MAYWWTNLWGLLVRKTVVHNQTNYYNLDSDQILAKLNNMEAIMSELSDAVARVAQRVEEDVTHLRDLLDQALATDAADAAEIARLKGEADALVAETNAAIEVLNAIDPDPANPAPVEPPVEEPPVV